MSKNKPTTILALTMVSLVAFGGPSMAQTPVPANPAQEEAFLNVLPKVTVPDDVRPIEGAVNEEWRSCRATWPHEYVQSQKGPEARAYRDIFGYVRAVNVIENKDCSCAGKVASWGKSEPIAKKLREQSNTKLLSWADTESISNVADELIAVAETMCGGPF
ncbi:hypothetical protein [Pseudorhodobacter ferrugineus]|uniref:hypothetical protein n=1 Tax=Pseudorhodobacter ferrugineus TaxID=77008 RepID=UPI000B0EFFC9|nr:hypothetical protein [Pseudorhodobacter ferrugineus]